MEHHELVLLQKMEEHSRKQLRCSRIQCGFCIVTAICCAVALIKFMQIMPQLLDLAAHMEAVLINLEDVSAELSHLEFADMVNNINSLVVSGQTGVEQALERINAIDIDALNDAIRDLSDVVEPMANFVKRFSFGG